MAASNVPPELKAIAPYLQRASELRGREPVVAYYCDYYAARMALEKMEQGSRSKEVQDFLYTLMDRLEQEKKQLSTLEAMTDDVVAKAYIENFALKIFINADNEDRAGKASKKTAKTFLAASMFLDLLKIFGDLDEEIDQKAKYARWKTADIIKAINEGRTPQSGPPGGEEGQLGSSMFEGNGDGSVSNAEFGFQGVPDVNARNGMAGPDSGAYGHLSPSVGPQGLPGSLPDFPSFPDPPVSRPDSAAGRAAAVPAPAAPRAAAPAPSAFDYSAQKMAGASQGGAYAYDPKVLSNAQKHARFAISAIQYDDIEAAVDNLKRALKYLEPYQRA